MEQFVNQGATQDSKTKKRKEAELKMSAFVALNTSFRVSSQLAGLVHATGVLQNPIYLAKYWVINDYSLLGVKIMLLSIFLFDVTFAWEKNSMDSRFQVPQMIL